MKLKWKINLIFALLGAGMLILAGLFLHAQGVNVRPAAWLAAGFLPWGLALGIAWQFYRRVLAPLNILLDAAAQAARGKLNYPLVVDSKDELSQLAGSMNEMILLWKSTLRDMSAEKNRMDAVLSNMTDPLIALDQVGRVMIINPAAERMLGMSSAEAMARYLIEILRNHELLSGIQEVLAGGEDFNAELRLIPGRPELFLCQAVPIREENRIVGAVLIWRDITDVRRLEQLRLQFVANVSHELRTPLTSIRGFVETLLDGALEDTQTALHFLNIIRAEALRLQQLVEDLLFLSRLENGPPPPEGSSHLDAAMEKALGLLEDNYQRRDINMQLSVPADLPALAIDGEFLEQVLLNLLDNALKFSPEGGEIIVGAHVLGNRVRVEVADQGLGIPAESLPRIFERFYRVDAARSRRKGGTGLGLAIVKHLVEAHHGQVGVESQPGRGSTFYFTLPTVNKGAT